MQLLAQSRAVHRKGLSKSDEDQAHFCCLLGSVRRALVIIGTDSATSIGAYPYD
jgi:hypothetical protein